MADTRRASATRPCRVRSRLWRLPAFGERQGERLGLLRLHIGENRRRFSLAHVLDHFEQYRHIQLFKYPCRLSWFHDFIYADDALNFRFILLILLLKKVIDILLHLLESGDVLDTAGDR